MKKGKAKIFEGEIRDKDGLARVGSGGVLEHAEILSMDYLVYGVTYMASLIEPIDNPLSSDLTVKTEYVS